MNYMFDLSNYEDVNSRIRRFQVAYPVGRIVTDVIQFNAEKGHILVSAQIYREHEDTLPAAVDYAFGDASTYPAQMRKFYVEDTVTSAIGRSLSLILETINKPTVQDMARAKLAEPKPEKYIPVVNEADPWTIKTVAAPSTSAEAVAVVKDIIGGTTDKDVPRCPHGEMHWAHGMTKANKPWGHFKCMAAATGEMNRCPKGEDVIWYEISPEGNWRPQKVRA
jgi:hypothetical protein